MNKILIIGNKGTLGSEFIRQLGDDATGWDRNEIDVTESEQVQSKISELNPQVVINCAAYTNVDAAESDYDKALLLNGTALKNLSLVCNNIGASLVHFSTGMVFPGTSAEGYKEDDATEPINAYGKTKLEGEKNIIELAKNFYIIRTEWLYGKPNTADAKPSFIDIMIKVSESGQIKGVTDEIGKPTWAKDLVSATLEIIRSKLPSGIYHIANEGQASRAEWAQEIYKILNKQVIIEGVSGNEFPRPAKRPQYELLNNTKFPKLRSWQEALKEYLTQSE